MNHDQVQELLADYALNLLDAEEAAQVERHVQSCETCPADLQALSQAGAALAIAPAPVELPPGAEARIAAGVRERVAALTAASSRVVPLGSDLKIIRGPWRTIAVGAAAAALLFAVGLTAVSMAWLDARDDRDRFENQLAARAIELPLSGQGASGVIYVAADFKSGVAAFAGLAPAPAQHHYQVWSEGPYGARSAADFTGNNGTLLVPLPELPKEMTRMFVTLEPDGANGQNPLGPEVLSTPR
ncbi:MAG: anti-sigma factor [bacterium]